MIFMLFSIMWGRIQEQTTNFEHLVHETWPQTCGRVIFKFYKKFVTYDAYHLVALFTKSWNFFGLQASYVTTCVKPSHFFIIASTYDIMTSRQVSRFSVFVCFLENLKTTRPQIRGHVSWTRCSKLVVCSWIRPHIILNNMNIIFPIIFFIIRITSSYNLNYLRKFNKMKEI